VSIDERTEPLALPAGPIAPAPRPARLSRAVAVLVRIAFDLLVIDAAVESWLAGSPLRVGLACGAVLYVALTAYVISKGGRIGGRGWLMDAAAGAIVFLGFAVSSTWTREWMVSGLRAVRHETPVVLAATMVALLVAAAVRMVGPGGARSWWVRVPVAGVSGYAAAAFGAAIAARTPFLPLLTGHGFWPGLPWWLQGTWIGAFVILPVALLRELLASIARLESVPYLRWMIVFALGCWIAYNAASLVP
jgi:hypothetical protein